MDSSVIFIIGLAVGCLVGFNTGAISSSHDDTTRQVQCELTHDLPCYKIDSHYVPRPVEIVEDKS